MTRRPPTPKRQPRLATPAALRDAIRDEALKLGFDAVGFAPAVLAPEARQERLQRLGAFVEAGWQGDMGWLGERAEERADPQSLWRDARTVVSLALNYAPASDPLEALEDSERAAISVYAQGRDYHEVVKSKLKALGRFIWDAYQHDLKVFVDTAPLMEKPAAQAVGHGWQGKHTNLVSRQFGSWLFLGEILLSVELPADQPETDHCGQCRACLDICPTNAFPAPYRLEARRCISYLTIEHEGPIDRELRPLLGNRIYGCDDCLAVCPWNKFAQQARETALSPRPALNAPLLAELATLDDARFRKRFAGTAVKRIGRDRFLRNVAYALGNSRVRATALPAVERLLGDSSPLVRGAAVWALSRLAPHQVAQRQRSVSEDDSDVQAEWLDALQTVPGARMATEISRRTLVELIGRLAGAATAYSALNLAGLLVTPTAYAAPPALKPGSGDGKRVAILGAGIAGMTAAYCLSKAGYQCTILEALAVWRTSLDGTRRRPDRRNGFTQRIEWTADRDIYFNAGAARISSHHQGILGYCRELGVPLELFVNDNRAALVQFDSQFGGKPQTARRLQADLRGAIAALAAKGVPNDETIQTVLRIFGDLRRDLSYAGSARAGYAVEDVPGAATRHGRLQPPLPLDEIAGPASIRMALALCFAEAWQQSPTMLQPVGGMDAIVRAFDRALGGMIRHNEEVVQIDRVGERARVISLDRSNGRRSALDADFVICTIPLSVLEHIPADFGAAVNYAISVGAKCYFPAVKVAFEAPRRWWEIDQQLYGGISWTGRDITQIWYPSHGFHGEKGVLVGAYIWNHAPALRFTAMTPAERRAAAIGDGERLHPGYEALVGPPPVAWAKIPYSLGAWIEWETISGTRQAEYPTLLAGDGPFYFAGEHMSYVTAWQEGAVQSAHYTVSQIAERVATTNK